MTHRSGNGFIDLRPGGIIAGPFSFHYSVDMLSFYRLASRSCCAMLVFLAAGCGGGPGDQPVVHPVHGTVTLDGAPLANAVVHFSPDQGPPSAAITDSSGKYELHEKSGTKGAVAATHTVTISTDLEGSRKKENEKVPPQYNTKTTLSVVVKEGDNAQDFPLKSK